jgi:hypothetical protein
VGPLRGPHSMYPGSHMNYWVAEQNVGSRSRTKEMILMKYLKMFGLTTVVAIALTALTGPGAASATTLTDGNGNHPTSIIASAESSLTLRAGFANITCTESTLAGGPNTGGASETVKGEISTLTFSNCGSSTVTVMIKGSFEIHTIGAGPNGTFTISGLEVKVAQAGTSCTYQAVNAHLGTITGSAATGRFATLDFEGKLKLKIGGFLCNKEPAWEGSYLFTSPSILNVD